MAQTEETCKKKIYFFFEKLIPCNNCLMFLMAHMLQGWLQSTPLLFLPHMFPQLCGISLRCHSGFVTLPAIQKKAAVKGDFTLKPSLNVMWDRGLGDGVGGFLSPQKQV